MLFAKLRHKCLWRFIHRMWISTFKHFQAEMFNISLLWVFNDLCQTGRQIIPSDHFECQHLVCGYMVFGHPLALSEQSESKGLLSLEFRLQSIIWQKMKQIIF